tara:strand:+ start:14655 stop:15086 length:432 start_codon:yes stop_codon:yes gene_type:complete
MEIEKKKMDARQDLDPKQWGPHTWAFLHAIADGAPENPTPEEFLAYSAVFDAIPTILPCQKCRQHAKERLDKTPISYMNGSDLRRSLWEFHNDVNVSLKKPIKPFDCCVNKEYLKPKTNKMFIIVLFVILVLLMISMGYLSCR